MGWLLCDCVHIVMRWLKGRADSESYSAGSIRFLRHVAGEYGLAGSLGHLPEPCLIIKSSNHRSFFCCFFYSSVRRASMTGNHFLTFTVSCVKWIWNKDEQLLASKAISQMEKRLKEEDSRTKTVNLCCLSLWSPSVQSAVISISIFEWHWII